MSRPRTNRYDGPLGDSDPHERLRVLAARAGTSSDAQPEAVDEPQPAAFEEQWPVGRGEHGGIEPDDTEPAGGWVPDRRRPGLAERLTRSGPWGALAERWVPEQLRTARFDPSRRGAIALSALAALAAIASAVGVWWTRPQPISVPDPLPSAVVTRDGDTAEDAIGTVPADDTAAAGGTGQTGAAEQQPDPGPIVVSVTGAVVNPGLVTLPVDARVADAIAAAGGVHDDADLIGLNLAAHLSDGSSIVVAGPAGSQVSAEEGATATGPSGTALINLNTAGLTELQQLSGVGPVTAQAILTYRQDHGPFVSIDQLEEVPGIGPATRARLAPLVTW